MEHSECPAGHQLIGEQCEDIDECEVSEVNCDIETQVCMNTVGSYECLDIEKNNEGAQCDTGLRFNAKTGECDGE